MGGRMSQYAERAVVTGGAGFLGSRLCERLLAEGVEVLCLDNLASATTRNIQDLTGHPRFSWIRCDVTEPLPVDGPVDVVFHLASPASPEQYRRLSIETMLAGSLGSQRGLELARATGARFVLASTSEVYGDPLEHPQHESYRGNVNPIGPRAVYDEAKRYAEALTCAFRDRHGVSVAIARIFNTYGPGMDPDDGRMIPTFVRQALCGEPLTVTGTGQQTRSLCYVSDTVRGLLALARAGCPEPVNIGNPHEETVLALARSVRDQAGSAAPIRLVDPVEDDPRRRCPDITRARRWLGWRPEVTFDDGIRRTIEWFADVLGAPVPQRPVRSSGST